MGCYDAYIIIKNDSHYNEMNRESRVNFRDPESVGAYHMRNLSGCFSFENLAIN